MFHFDETTYIFARKLKTQSASFTVTWWIVGSADHAREVYRQSTTGIIIIIIIIIIIMFVYLRLSNATDNIRYKNRCRHIHGHTHTYIQTKYICIHSRQFLARITSLYAKPI